MKEMKRNALALSISLGMIFGAQFLAVQAQRIGVNRVLLLSVDGLHSIDLVNCVQNNTCPNLASLANKGVTYTNASSSKPSDSFPGLLAMVTGGTPLSTGVFYDDSYDRQLFPPSATPDCTGSKIGRAHV